MEAKNGEMTKVTGYLEKKGYMKVISPWKKYWFVLEGRLLLYYRSKDEYESLSPCKGSINLALPWKVKPCSSANCSFQLEKKTTTITLRADNRPEQEKWMQALLVALKSQDSGTNQAKLNHFRYSQDEVNLPDEPQDTEVVMCKRQNTLPARFRCSLSRKQDVVTRLQRVGAKCYWRKTNQLDRLKESIEKYNDLYASLDNDEHAKNSTTNGGTIVENTDYISVDDRTSLVSERKRVSEDNLVDNDQYVRAESIDFCKNHCLKESQQINDLAPYATVNIRNRVSNLIVDNEMYDTPKSQNASSHPADPVYAVPHEEVDVNRNSIPLNGALKSSQSNLKESDDSCLLKVEPIYQEPSEIIVVSNVDNNVKQKKKKRRFFSYRTLRKKDAAGLQSRRKSLIRGIWKVKKKSKEMPQEVEPGVEPDDQSTKLLTELQRLLIEKRRALEEQFGPEYDEIKDPALPPRKSSPKPPPKAEADRSLDEILDDLDRQQAKCNFQRIIDKFNEQSDGSVVLRRLACSGAKSNDSAGCSRDFSTENDLDKLLDELSKVTTAPVRSPGITCSLNTHNTTDEELLKLLPVRTRRHSDPDYDIPRPHSSLVIPQRERDEEDFIPATRFFGPPLDIDNEPSRIGESNSCSSMTPDSLEPTETSNIRCDPILNPSYLYDHVVNPTRGTLHANTTKLREQEDINVYLDSLEVNSELSTAF